MPILCRTHYESRVQVKVNGQVVYFEKVRPGIRYEIRSVQPPWRTPVYWQWLPKYPRELSGYEWFAPIQLIVVNGSYYDRLDVISSNGLQGGGERLTPRGFGKPWHYRPPRVNYTHQQPRVLSYVVPPPPRLYYLDLYPGDRGNGGSYARTWSQSGSPPEIEAECSCNMDTQIQCGNMGETKEEDDYCCMSCSSLRSTFDRWGSSLQKIEDLITYDEL